jgi:hypothetical protein
MPLYAVLACALAAACAPDLPRKPNADQETAAIHASDTTPAAQGRIGDGDSVAPVEARLGAHVFRFPANYYNDQRGPYADGSVGLTLLWPDLAPAAPGQMPTRGDAAYDTRVQLGAVAVEGTAGNAALRRLIEPDPDEPEQRDDPRAISRSESKASRSTDCRLITSTRRQRAPSCNGNTARTLPRRWTKKRLRIGISPATRPAAWLR